MAAAVAFAVRHPSAGAFGGRVILDYEREPERYVHAYSYVVRGAGSRRRRAARAVPRRRRPRGEPGGAGGVRLVRGPAGRRSHRPAAGVGRRCRDRAAGGFGRLRALVRPGNGASSPDSGAPDVARLPHIDQPRARRQPVAGGRTGLGRRRKPLGGRVRKEAAQGTRAARAADRLGRRAGAARRRRSRFRPASAWAARLAFRECCGCRPDRRRMLIGRARPSVGREPAPRGAA